MIHVHLMMRLAMMTLVLVAIKIYLPMLLVLLKFMELNQVTVRPMMKLMKSPKNKSKDIGLAPYYFVS